MIFLKRFWAEESGFLISLELILAAIMLVFGMIAGMQVLRDSVAQELADLGLAIGSINNSFVITGIAGPDKGTGNVSTMAGSTFTDAQDNCDAGSIQAIGGLSSGGIALGTAGTAEAS